MTSRVLVTDADQRAALSVTRSLGKAGFEVHTASASRWPIAAASRWARRHHRLPDPFDAPVEFGQMAAQLARAIGAAVVLPITDQSCLALLEVADRFKDAVLPLPSLTTFRTASDKLYLAHAAPRYGIRVPPFRVIDSCTLPDDEELRFPVVVKPSRSIVTMGPKVTRVGVVQARGRHDLDDVLSSLPDGAFPVMLQEQIIGHGLGIFVLLWEGSLLASFSHRRLREKPPSGGVSVYSESIAPPEGLVDRIRELLADLGWRGVAMAEFKLEQSSGEPYLMEINGRFWGSLQLAVDAGVDFPALLVRAALGRPVASVTSWPVGERLRWCLGDLDHLVTRILHSDAELGLPAGTPSRRQLALDMALPWRSPGRSEVFRWTDPLPGVVEAISWIRSL